MGAGTYEGDSMLRNLLVAAVGGLCAIAIAAAPAPASTLPDGFVDEHVGTVLVPTSLAALPDGQLLVTQKNGFVRLIGADGQLRSQTVLSVYSRFCNDAERGLLGVAVDPNFSVNRFFYVYWTLRRSGGCGNPNFNGPVNRVTRHVLGSDGVAVPSSEYVVLDGIPSKLGIHNAGDLEFGRDGFLYVSVGDGGCHWSDGSKCADANYAARERHTLLGKVLRVTRDGTPAPGNPSGGVSCRLGSAQSGQVCAEAYLRGLRNPFRFAFDPNASGTRFFVNDVGSRTWEEVNEAVAGSDYGWNLREGPCAIGSSTNCAATSYRNPIHAYNHSTGCSSITGGAFVPNDLWPAPYAGSYLFADFVCGKVFRRDPGGAVSTFATDLGPVTHLRFAPTPEGGRALYYVGFENDGVIRRIRHVGAVNRRPDARLEVRATGTSLDVEFDASASSDPDGDPVTYVLDPGDGSGPVERSTPTTTHTYAQRGVYTATLVVKDDEGLASQPATRQVVVGDQPPAIEVLSPTPLHRFRVGEQVQLKVRAIDPEDGELPDSAVRMFVERAHATHRHPWREEETGTQQVVTAPPPEDLYATTNSHLVVTVAATDSSGQTTVREFPVMPNDVLFLLKANKPVTFTVNGYSVKQDTHLRSWEGWTMNVVAPLRYDLLNKFKRWEGTGSTNPARVIVTPAVDSHYFATYGCC